MNSSGCSVPIDPELVKRPGLIPISSKCQSCKAHTEHLFCNLPVEAGFELDRIKRFKTFAPGARLFAEGQAVQDLIIVCEGAATLSMSSCNGRVVVLGFSEIGEVLGLSSLLSGHSHETTADALVNTRVAMIARNDFLRFMDRYPSAAVSAGSALSRKVNRAYDKIRLIGSGLSVPQRLAAWLLRMQLDDADAEDRVRVTLTHEKISQLLGVSRESVTRALSAFRKMGVVEIRGIHLYVRDRAYLRSLLYPTELIQLPQKQCVMSVTDKISFSE